jgi:hypothetical protein
MLKASRRRAKRIQFRLNRKRGGCGGGVDPRGAGGAPLVSSRCSWRVAVTGVLAKPSAVPSSSFATMPM